MSAHDLWFSPSAGYRIARGLLTPLSWVYAAGWQAYVGLYRSGIKRAQAPHFPVLCVGNLTVGGSGKSPLTLHLYDVLRSMDRPAMVGVSGYGSPASEGAQIAPEGPLAAHEYGDEAAMLRWFRPEMPLVVGRRRVLAAELTARHRPGHVLLMDDGLQHLPLHKDLTILIDDPDPPNPRCLPAGPYREPRVNRSRADLVLPGKFRIVWTSRGPVDPKTMQADGDVGLEIQVLTSIARPERFLNDLTDRGFQIRRRIDRPDHDPLTTGNLLASFDRAVPLVVTAKDWVKLKDRPDVEDYRVFVAWNEAKIEPDAAFRELLHGKLTQIA